jgi:hypothetical protein
MFKINILTKFFLFFQDDGNSLNMVSGSDWTNIIIPGDLGDSGFHHEKSFLLTDLVRFLTDQSDKIK